MIVKDIYNKGRAVEALPIHKREPHRFSFFCGLIDNQMLRRYTSKDIIVKI